MHSEIVLPGGQIKDQHKQCKLAAIFVHQTHALPTMLISLPICFYAEFILQKLGKCRLRNCSCALIKNKHW